MPTDTEWRMIQGPGWDYSVQHRVRHTFNIFGWEIGYQRWETYFTGTYKNAGQVFGLVTGTFTTDSSFER
jgi:hypothetical protein